MEGDLFCWNPKCMASPIFEEYFHNDIDNAARDAGDVNMEESGDSISKMSVEEDNGRLGSSGMKNGTVSSTLSSTVQEPCNSFQHRTIIDPAVSYALYAPVKVMKSSSSNSNTPFYMVCDEKPHLSVLTLFYFPTTSQWIETRKRKKNVGYESFSADPVLYRWQCWAASQGVGNSALDGMVYYPYPMDNDYSAENSIHQEVNEVVTHSQCQCSVLLFLSSTSNQLYH